VDIARILLEYLKALAWPVVAFTVALVYKTQLIGVLGRLKRAGLPGGVSLDFMEEAREVRELSDHIRELPSKNERK
jgi:hypothetical protein